MTAIKSGTIYSFDVDFAPCACPGEMTVRGTTFKVIPVSWHRADTNPRGAVLFECQSCGHTWTLKAIASAGGGIQLDSSHPGENARRRGVHDFERTTVNLFQGHRQPSQSDRMAMYRGIL